MVTIWKKINIIEPLYQEAENIAKTQNYRNIHEYGAEALREKIVSDKKRLQKEKELTQNSQEADK